MDKELRFFEKSVYGNMLTYPVKEISQAFQNLTGKKTADKYQLEALKELGFQVVINKADFETVYL